MARVLILAIPIILLGTAFRPIFSLHANDVTGTWKRTSMTLVDASGNKTDMNQMLEKTMPCTKDITYSFSTDGQLKTNVPDACGSLKKTIESMNVTGRWSISGRKLTVTTTKKEIPTATYDVNFQDNTMTWVFNYVDNPNTPNPTKAKQIAIVYQRV